MAKTQFIRDNMKNFIKAAELRVDRLDREVYQEGQEDKRSLLYYWQGKVDGLKFASEMDDDFFYLNLIELLKKENHKETVKFLKTLIDE